MTGPLRLKKPELRRVAVRMGWAGRNLVDRGGLACRECLQRGMYDRIIGVAVVGRGSGMRVPGN